MRTELFRMHLINDLRHSLGESCKDKKSVMPFLDSSPMVSMATDTSKKDREIARLAHEVTTLTLTVMHL